MEKIEETDTDIKITESGPSTNNKKKAGKTWLFILIAIVLLAITITLVVFLAKSEPSATGQIRDIFIILMALESLVIGIALVILVIQLAILTNLIQNEVKPILDSTNETVNTLKGTTKFLSNNMVEPVIKLNEYLAGLKKVLEILRLVKH